MKKLNILILSVIVSTLSMAQERTFTITAHSGAYGTEDNSMEFITTALAHDDDILEFDVRQRPDGTLVMSHDSVVSNTAGTEIAKALKAIKGHRTRVNLDIKERRTLPTLYNMLRELKMEEQVFMTGIGINDVTGARQHCPGIQYYLNCEPKKSHINSRGERQRFLAMLKESGAVGVNCNYKFCTRKLVSMLHSNGYQLSIWTVNEQKDMKKYAKRNPDNMTTRHPDILREALNRNKQ